MFKYIATILKTFTSAQRILALMLLLFFISVIMVGPAIIKSFKSNDEELTLRITSQNKQIKELTIRVDELNDQVIDNQRECTNQLLSKEREIVAAVTEIINEAERQRTALRPLVREHKQSASGYGGQGSSGETVVKSAPPPPLEPIIDNNHLVNKLKDLKKKYQRELERN
jgi:hypothetical protein